MTYQELEQAVAALLNPLSEQGFRVDPMPERLADLNLKRHEKGAVTIFYEESNFEDSKSIDFIVQPERVHLLLICSAPQLRGEFGLYELIRKIKALLIGADAPPFKRFRLVSDKVGSPFGQEENLWHRTITVMTERDYIQEYEEPEPQGYFAGATIETNFGTYNPQS